LQHAIDDIPCVRRGIRLGERNSRQQTNQSSQYCASEYHVSLAARNPSFRSNLKTKGGPVS